jgi:hypothetical protein
MKEQILNILSVIVSGIGASFALMMLHRKIEAEKELSNKLKNKTDELFRLLENGQSERNRTDDSVNVINIDEDKLKELIAEVKQVAKELPKRKRGEILDSLEQKSPIGQVNYLNRLLHLSGSNVNLTAQG